GASERTERVREREVANRTSTGGKARLKRDTGNRLSTSLYRQATASDGKLHRRGDPPSASDSKLQ
ncbi:hypothetical protein Ancab_028477, partial [Ancistrocladus abbreviatus]